MAVSQLIFTSIATAKVHFLHSQESSGATEARQAPWLTKALSVAGTVLVLSLVHQIIRKNGVRFLKLSPYRYPERNFIGYFG